MKAIDLLEEYNVNHHKFVVALINRNADMQVLMGDEPVLDDDRIAEGLGFTHNTAIAFIPLFKPILFSRKKET